MLEQYLSQIQPSNNAHYQQAQQRWANIAKPLKGMGILEDYIAKIAAIHHPISLDKRCVAVFCADNGIVVENVTQTGSEVTQIVAQNMVQGKATVSNMAQVAKADVFVYDVGMLTEGGAGVIARKQSLGTANFAHQPAMTVAQAKQSIITGIEVVKELKEQGYTLIASGEMGIGNTTTSTAIACALLQMAPSQLTGKGAGLSKDGIRHKAKVIEDALNLHRPNPQDPIDVLSKVGGYDIGAMCGLFLGGAIYQVPIIIDGFISSVSALLAYMLHPSVADYMLASHLSGEPAAIAVLNKLGLTAPLHCQMALGEGTGAIALMPLLDMASSVYHNMPSFTDTEIEAYQPL